MISDFLMCGKPTEVDVPPSAWKGMDPGTSSQHLMESDYGNLWAFTIEELQVHYRPLSSYISKKWTERLKGPGSSTY